MTQIDRSLGRKTRNITYCAQVLAMTKIS